MKAPLCRIVLAIALSGGLACNKSDPTHAAGAIHEKIAPPSAIEKPQLKQRPRPAAKPSSPEDKMRQRQPAPRARSIAQPGVNPGLARELRRQLGELQSRRANPAHSSSAAEQPLGEIIEAYTGAVNDEAKVEALHSLAGRDDPQAAALLVRAAADGSSIERAAALQALAERPSAEHLPLVDAALNSSDPDIQAAALWLLRHIASDSALPVWNHALSHPSVEVAQTAIDLLSDAPAFLQVPVARLALARNQPWLTEQALNLLGGITSKPAVEALIPYLGHPSAGDLAQSGLFFLLSESFETVEQARAWWQKNAANLGPDLQPLDLQ